MIGFYVFGGGRGHLTRVRRFIDQLPLSNVLVYTGNKDVQLFFKPSEIVLFDGHQRSTAEELRHFLIQDWQTRHFDDFYVDCFPLGILREIPFESLSAQRIHYLARRLKVASYPLDNLPVRFDTTYVFEPLEAGHHVFVERHSLKIHHFSFEFSVKSGLPTPPKAIPTPYWLVLHSSHENEVALLLLKAFQLMEQENQKAHCLLVSDCCPEIYQNEVIWLQNEFEPSQYFEGATRIISGAGFNTMLELKNFHNKHVCLPFERKFDDQKWRIEEIIGMKRREEN